MNCVVYRDGVRMEDVPLAAIQQGLAAFKGVGTSFRSWNGQLRQPILVATAKLPVTVSPQPGFLHQFSVLDTLGIDRPETTCVFK